MNLRRWVMLAVVAGAALMGSAAFWRPPVRPPTIVASAAAAAVEVPQTSATSAPATPHATSARVAAVVPSSAAPVAPAAVRAQIRQRVESEVTALTGVAEMRRYLAQLEARAVAQGSVSALEVEPGIEAIQRFEQELGDAFHTTRTEFSLRMAELSRTLTPQVAGQQQSIDDSARQQLLERIRSTREESSRQPLIEQYLHAISRLPREQEHEALVLLEQARATR